MLTYIHKYIEIHCIRIKITHIFPSALTYREVGWDAEGKLEGDFRQVGRQLLEVDALRAAACERCLKHTCERGDDRRYK